MAAEGGPMSSSRSTTDRILTAAERLYAERGLDAVSVRDITTAARVNTAAIHYHFGSKDGLVAAVLQRRAEQLGGRRDELLREIEASRAPVLRDVVAAMVVPAAELAADRRRGGRHYVGFLAAVLSHPEHIEMVSDVFDPFTTRYLEALERVTPHLAPDVRAFRFAVAKDLVNRSLSRPAAVHAWLAQHAPGADEPLTDRLIDLLTGAFGAPATA
jgi:AcrR family transcriptional regulator